jgi:hypothetical protein
MDITAAIFMKPTFAEWCYVKSSVAYFINNGQEIKESKEEFYLYPLVKYDCHSGFWTFK